MPIETQPTKGTPVGGQQPEFKEGLFECCGDINACLCGYFCPCIVGKHVAEEMGDNGTCWCLTYIIGLWMGAFVNILFQYKTSNGVF